ncbi:sulfatase-like hydrolase/transferase [Pseudomonas sp. PIC25]|uniref:sulfatase-like hydrolase/transferase n=1 Tax=Pseudomonas sp. PIC25 TaxID=1958773 RepID=UPI00117B9EFA|nr:sulfatase-like hydrolase/transferase [Pseudomonas sp. PIC25]
MCRFLFFLLFGLFYYFPLFLDLGSLSEEGGFNWRAIFLAFDFSLAAGLAVCFLVHLGLLLIFFLSFCWLGRRAAKALGVKGNYGEMLLLLLGWLSLMAVNSRYFPASSYSAVLSFLPVWSFEALLALWAGVFISLAWGGTWRSFAFFTVLAGMGFGWAEVSGEVGVPAEGRNVILIGVDSLSGDVLSRYENLLPNMRGLMKASLRFDRAYTPLGRTFPAWVSILSGKYPADHGAVFNLRSLGHVQRQGLVSSVLRESGYKTVFAIDERRFCNIDESFGFDRVVGPRAGALDFLLQRVNDTPLTNFLLQSALSEYLLPYSYLNVASYTNYSSSGFVEGVLRAAQSSKPIFLAVHLESAHFPYRTRHSSLSLDLDNRFLEQHLRALQVVDQQIGEIIQGLREQGRLDNALVVLLSDHGEGVGELEATVMLDGKSTELRSYGHGADILSDHQNRIALGMAVFQDGYPASSPGVRHDQVSLLNLREVIERYVGAGSIEVSDKNSCLIVETGLRIEAASDYRNLKESEVFSQAIGLYRIEGGRLSLREEEIPRLLVAKDIGLRCRNHITWHSFARQKYYSFLLDDRGVPVRQVEAPSADIEEIEKYSNIYRQGF